MRFRQHGRDHFPRPVVRQFFRHRPSQRVRIRRGCLRVCRQHHGTVGVRHQAVQRQQAVFVCRAIRAQRHLAAAAQRPCQRTLGGNAGGGLRMVERQKDVHQIGAVRGNFDAQRALPRLLPSALLQSLYNRLRQNP